MVQRTTEFMSLKPAIQRCCPKLVGIEPQYLREVACVLRKKLGVSQRSLRVALPGPTPCDGPAGCACLATSLIQGCLLARVEILQARLEDADPQGGVTGRISVQQPDWAQALLCLLGGNERPANRVGTEVKAENVVGHSELLECSGTLRIHLRRVDSMPNITSSVTDQGLGLHTKRLDLQALSRRTPAAQPFNAEIRCVRSHTPLRRHSSPMGHVTQYSGASVVVIMPLAVIKRTGLEHPEQTMRAGGAA